MHPKFPKELFELKGFFPCTILVQTLLSRNLLACPLFKLVLYSCKCFASGHGLGPMWKDRGARCSDTLIVLCCCAQQDVSITWSFSLSCVKTDLSVSKHFQRVRWHIQQCIWNSPRIAPYLESECQAWSVSIGMRWNRSHQMSVYGSQYRWLALKNLECSCWDCKPVFKTYWFRSLDWMPELQIVADYVAMTPDGKVFDSSLDRGRPYDLRVGSGQVSPFQFLACTT